MTAEETLGQEYDSAFFADMSQGSRRSAQVIIPLVTELAAPASVLDVGCGVGTWLAEWVNHGVTDVLGLDGEYVDTAELQINKANFESIDLQRSFSLGRRFDLVECLEVAEHLEASYADQLVQSLTSHGDLILFSAAIPGQGGTHHVNEQWPSYWIEKFGRAGFKPYDVIRPKIWTDPSVEVWYRQNTLLFSRGLAFDVRPDKNYDVVHPISWAAGTDFSRDPGKVVRSAPSALIELLKRRLQRRR